MVLQGKVNVCSNACDNDPTSSGSMGIPFNLHGISAIAFWVRGCPGRAAPSSGKADAWRRQMHKAHLPTTDATDNPLQHRRSQNILPRLLSTLQSELRR